MPSPQDFEAAQGEIPDIGQPDFARAPDRMLADAQALSPEGYEVVGTVTADDGTEHEITEGSHEFEPSGVAGKLLMRARSAVEGHEKAIAIGTAAGTLVTVAAALAVRKTFKGRKV